MNRITEHTSRVPLAALSLASLAALAGACATGDDPAPVVAAPAPAAADPAGAIEGDVDTLLAALVALDDLVRHGQLTAQATADYDRLERLVADLVASAEALRATPGAPATIHALSRKAGQLAPQLRAVRRALERTGLDGAARADLATRLTRVRVAAASLDRSVRALHGGADAARLAALGEAAGRRNGPLYPGSSVYVLDQGHIDPVDVAYEDGELGISIHDETVDPDVERDPAYTVMVVKAAAKLEVPDARFGFVGPAGTTAWVLPEGQLEAEAAGILWPGLAADEVEVGTFLGDTVEIRFKEVIGPNGLAIFESPPDEVTPPNVLVDSEDGLPDSVTVPAGTHRHANWAFEAAGVYLVKVDARGRLAGVAGNPWVTSSTAVLKFVVQP